MSRPRAIIRKTALGTIEMKTLHSGSNEFQFVRTETIAFDWKFESAEDHEHPYVLTVTVAGQTHSEGYQQDIGKEQAAAEAKQLAHEVHASARRGDDASS
jgi:hypothetical protein